MCKLESFCRCAHWRVHPCPLPPSTLAQPSSLDPLSAFLPRHSLSPGHTHTYTCTVIPRQTCAHAYAYVHTGPPHANTHAYTPTRPPSTPAIHAHDIRTFRDAPRTPASPTHPSTPADVHRGPFSDTTASAKVTAASQLHGLLSLGQADDEPHGFLGRSPTAWSRAKTLYVWVLAALALHHLQPLGLLLHLEQPSTVLGGTTGATGGGPSLQSPLR